MKVINYERYYDIDGVMQYFSNFGVNFICNYNNRTIVKDDYHNKFMIWCELNRPFSVIGKNNELQPLTFNTVKELKKYINLYLNN